MKKYRERDRERNKKKATKHCLPVKLCKTDLVLFKSISKGKIAQKKSKEKQFSLMNTLFHIAILHIT